MDADHGLLRYEITTANLDIDNENPTVQDDFTLLGGTITGLRILKNGDTIYLATGYNLDAVEIQDAIDVYDESESNGDTSQFVNLLHSQPYVIYDGGGIDTLIGGNLDDIIVVHSNAPWNVDGGDGIDMLRLEGTFDIPGTQGLPVVNGIEIIDLGDESHTHVSLDAGSLYAMSQTSQLGALRILGGDGYDSITLFPNAGELQGTWTKEDGLTSFGDAYTGDTTFDRYTFTLGDDDLSIYVQHGVGVTMMPPSEPLLG
ncbi:MAG: hypothetical protein AB7O55_32990 [Lautropia sp.]